MVGRSLDSRYQIKWRQASAIADWRRKPPLNVDCCQRRSIISIRTFASATLLERKYQAEQWSWRVFWIRVSLLGPFLYVQLSRPIISVSSIDLRRFPVSIYSKQPPPSVTTRATYAQWDVHMGWGWHLMYFTHPLRTTKIDRSSLTSSIFHDTVRHRVGRPTGKNHNE